MTVAPVHGPGQTIDRRGSAVNAEPSLSPSPTPPTGP